MKLALGTVQFGINYGVANKNGQVDSKEVIAILDYAKSVGINLLDTAATYGMSESVLGGAGVSNWKCITKLGPLPYDVTCVKGWVTDQINQSLKNLKIPSIHAILLHKPSDLLGEFGKEYLATLLSLKNSGIFQGLGYSIYSPDRLEELTSMYWPDVVQTPYNVFDQRIKNSGWLERLWLRNTKIHARSIFLQGLLIMDHGTRPAYFHKWNEQFSSWDEVLRSCKMSSVDAALSYVLSENRFEKVIIGVNSAQQLKELVEVKVKSIGSLRELSSLDVDLIEPNRWNLD
jgi:aryl-alcohol dehydrogenase-like predicted oxidoreductase